MKSAVQCYWTHKKKYLRPFLFLIFHVGWNSWVLSRVRGYEKLPAGHAAVRDRHAAVGSCFWWACFQENGQPVVSQLTGLWDYYKCSSLYFKSVSVIQYVFRKVLVLIQKNFNVNGYIYFKFSFYIYNRSLKMSNINEICFWRKIMFTKLAKGAIAGCGSKLRDEWSQQ